MGFSLTPTKEVKPMATVSITHGVPGVGKTSLWAYAPDPLFLMVKDETGLQTLMDKGRVPGVQHFPEPAQSMDDVNAACDEVARGRIKCKTLVIDTINSVEQLIHKQTREDMFNNDPAAFMAFQGGYDAALPAVENFIGMLRRVHARGVAIAMIAHTKVEGFKNPLGPDYDRYVPTVHKKTWLLLNGFADLVLFANYEAVASAEKDAKAPKGKMKVTTAASQAFLYPIRTAAYDAKNRHGLTGKISMGRSGQEAWNNLERALKSCKTTGKQEQEPEVETETQPEIGKEAA
jgi:hypothetical protein